MCSMKSESWLQPLFLHLLCKQIHQTTCCYHGCNYQQVNTNLPTAWLWFDQILLSVAWQHEQTTAQQSATNLMILSTRENRNNKSKFAEIITLKM